MTQNTHPHERLEIDNFLVITKAHFDVKRINVIIGEQASGKSVIAKVLYFFRHTIQNCSNILYHDIDWRLPPDSIKKNKQKLLSFSFNKIFFEFFNQKIWKHHSFTISYELNGEVLVASYTKGERSLRFDFPDTFLSDIDKMIDNILLLINSPLGLYLGEEIRNTTPTIYIPSNRMSISRSFSSELTTDYFFRNFIRLYDTSTDEKSYRAEESDYLYNTIQSSISKILNGSYERTENEVSIYMNFNNGIVPVSIAYASSGQQESLPMLAVIAEHSTRARPQCFIIEEPEAHLFPIAQRVIVQIMGTVYNYSHNFFLTTHSPYILVALNNLIMAGNVAREHPDKQEDVNKIIPKDMQVNFEDVGAYTIKQGILTPIMDEESLLIDANDLDTASEFLNDEFNEILELRY